MSDNTRNQQDGLQVRKTLPTLTPQNTDRRPPTATTVTAQQHAQQLVQRRLTAAARQRDDAERTEDREDDDRDHEPVSMRIQWEHTTRYEADLSVDPWVSDDELLARLDALPDSRRRVIETAAGDSQSVSVIDLYGKATSTPTRCRRPDHRLGRRRRQHR